MLNETRTRNSDSKLSDTFQPGKKLTEVCGSKRFMAPEPRTGPGSAMKARRSMSGAWR